MHISCWGAVSRFEHKPDPSTGLGAMRGAPLKTSPPPRDTHLSWAKKVMFKTAKKGNIGTHVKRKALLRRQDLD